MSFFIDFSLSDLFLDSLKTMAMFMQSALVSCLSHTETLKAHDLAWHTNAVQTQRCFPYTQSKLEVSMVSECDSSHIINNRVAIVVA